jgi:hypothetical protein
MIRDAGFVLEAADGSPLEEEMALEPLTIA